MEPTRAVSSTDRAARSMPAVWRLLVTCVQLLLLLTVESSEAAGTYSLQEGAVTSRRLQAFTDSTNLPRHGPANESFRLSDGSWVDCVPIENQIAAHHPTSKIMSSRIWCHLQHPRLIFWNSLGYERMILFLPRIITGRSGSRRTHNCSQESMEDAVKVSSRCNELATEIDNGWKHLVHD
jgi:hypothetical protein